jgi:hypothetical protein
MEYPMTYWKSEHRFASGFTPYSWGRHIDLPILTAIAIAPGIVLAWFVPLPLVLPLVSVLSFVIAGIVSLLAYASGADRHARGITPWDVAGIFALIWVGAGLACSPEHAVQLFITATQ